MVTQLRLSSFHFHRAITQHQSAIMSLSSLISLSSAVGWTYTALWTISFWPQVYLNWKRQSTAGLSYDHLSLNVVGYLAYSIFTGVSLFSSAESGARAAGSPAFNDFCFALHGLIIILVQIAQCICYERNRQTVHWGTKVFLFLCVASAAFLAAAALGSWTFFGWRATFPFWLQWVGETKVVITMIKYVPQVRMNRRHGSTAGWAIWGVLTDILGGALSLAQMGVQGMACSRYASCGSQCSCPSVRVNGTSGSVGPWSVLTLAHFGGVWRQDLPKVFLALVSIAFDIIFLVQHFVLYGPRRVGGVNFALSAAPIQGDDGGDEMEMGEKRLVDVLLEEDDLLELFGDFAETFARGEAPDDVARVLALVRFVALRKSSARIRGIATAAAFNGSSRLAHDLQTGPRRRHPFTRRDRRLRS